MEPADERSEGRKNTSPPHDPGRFGAKPRSSASVAAGAGIQFALSIVVFLFLGQWLDRRLGTAPVFLLGCVFVGAAASFYSMYRQLMAAQRRDAARRAEARRAEGGPS
jgi:F0F1-type ATP synthase assembly protein I